VKRLINQLREAQYLIIQLRGENKEMKVKIVAHLDDYEKVIDNSRNMVKISLYIDKKLKNVYKHKMVLQKENKVLKRKLHRLEEDVAKRNLDMLAQVVN
jgi:predicted transglutaminase-like protease